MTKSVSLSSLKTCIHFAASSRHNVFEKYSDLIHKTPASLQSTQHCIMVLFNLLFVKKRFISSSRAFHRLVPGLDVDGDGHSPVEELRGRYWFRNLKLSLSLTSKTATAKNTQQKQKQKIRQRRQ